MAIETSLDQRIEQMLSTGKLSPEEAARLQTAVRRQGNEERRLQHASAAQRDTRRLRPLLVLLVVALALGAASGWLLTSAPDPSVALTTVAPTATAEGRPIDLSQLDAERRQSMNRSLPLMVGVIPLGMLAVLGVVLVFIYNGLVSAREQVNAGWAQVENVYQRRLDLVPVLVDAVQTYTEHERETLTELTEARAGAIQAQSTLGGAAPQSAEQLQAIEASQGQIESALGRLFAVVEAYPELKASRNFVSLQDQLEGTENRVAMERRSYNEFSRRYNTQLQTFPSNLVAQMMGFESKPYFEAEETALEAPEDPFGRRQG
jgi:LemA protein